MPYKVPKSEPIAVVGSSCRFAGGANSPSRLWQLLANPTDLSREVPPERFNIKGFFHHDGEYHGTTDSPRAYFLDQDHRVFDAGFFNIHPKEAEAIDPQHRLLLEVVYEALESAGYTLQQYEGKKVAVFAGLMAADYEIITQRDELDTSQYCATGTARSMLSNRISYFFDFTGPSVTIDTACSASLVALHQAVLSLRAGDCAMACVAGANLILTPEQFIAQSSLHMLSPEGRCRMWDAEADGYARGEGVAAIFVKPLSRALADGDRIDAVIRETGVNSDGRTKGITMPNPKAQSRLIQDTYQRAGLDPKDPEDRCQYFEAHGTGTQAGDPKEAAAIEDAFFGHGALLTDTNDKLDTSGGRLDTPAAVATNLLVGSVKTVIGHTEGAAGLAGLLKVVESMRHDCVPPNLHLNKLNPAVEKHCTNLTVPTIAVPWPPVPPGRPKRASVNSFGFGGTNAHVIVEQYLPEVHDPVARFFSLSLESFGPARPGSLLRPRQGSQVCLPLVLSAPSQKSLAAVARAYRDYLIRHPQLRPEELAWHVFARRTAFQFRAAVSGVSGSDLVSKLGSLISTAENSSTVAIGTRARQEHEQPKILGIFTGQGAQWATMSRGLLLTSEVYAATIRSLDRILQRCPDPPTWALEQEILAEEARSSVHKASVSQPLCTAIQLALVNLLRHLGISFHTVVGHSSGEIAAAYAAGRISLRDAIVIAYYRGMSLDLPCGGPQPKGGMLAAGLSRSEAEELCAQKEYCHGLYIAAVNSPSSVTLSGDLDLVRRAADRLIRQKKFVRMLPVDMAYHSPHMRPPSVKYLDALNAAGISPSAGGNGTAWVSSVYGEGEPSGAELAGCYWRDNLVKPVLFYEAVSRALDTHGPFNCAIEVGPHPALKSPVAQIMKEKGLSIPYSGLLRRNGDDREAFAEFLGWMWAHFGPSSSQIRQFVLGSKHPQLVNSRLSDPPSYPWDHSQVYYRESRISRQYHSRTHKPHELLGVRTRDDNKHQLRWRNMLKLEKLKWAKHHSFQGQALLPASAYLVMALDAARVVLAGRRASIVELREVKLLSGITLEPNTPGVEVLFSLTVEQDGHETIEASFMLTSALADGRTDMKKNFSGKLTITFGEPSATALPSRPKDRAETLHASPEVFYDAIAETGLAYTGPFKALQTLERRYNFASGTLKKRHPEDSTGLTVSPATLDSCLQTAFVAISSPGDNAIWTSFLPVDIECVRFNLAICDINGADERLAVDAFITEAKPCTEKAAASFTGDIEIFNERGDMEVQVQGLTIRSFSSSKPQDDYELHLTTTLDVDPDDEIVSAEGSDVYTPSQMLAESCERVASFYINAASAGRPGFVFGGVSVPGMSQAESPTSANSWPRETEQTLEAFIRASPYFFVLNVIRQLGKSSPQVLKDVLSAIVEEAHQVVEFQKHVTRVVRQIFHKYARMNVLGLTDPELGLSEPIITGLGDSFLSYRVGAEPEETVESRVLLSDSLREKVKVDKLDLAANEPEQGPPYDLVLLDTSLIENQNMAAALHALRRMMRPGGFLILVHDSRNPLKDRLWEYAGVPQNKTAIGSPNDWPHLLDQCGFGQSMRNSHQHYPPGFSLIIRQAQSQEKALLLHPLQHSKHLRLADWLLVVGGTNTQTSLISSGVCSALAARCGSIHATEALESLDPATVSSFSAAILLNDVDKPVLATMTKQHTDVLRALFRPDMSVLWVTKDARFSNPDNAASLGFTRTIAAETPGLALQVLDLDSLDGPQAVPAVVETFARLRMQAVVGGSGGTKPLWINEPEVHLEKGRRVVPRLLPWKEANDRVNAARRVVSKVVNTLHNPANIVPAQSEDSSVLYEVKVQNTGVLSHGSTGHPKIQVNYSTVEAVDIEGSCSAYLCIGRNSETGGTQVALSKTNASYVEVPRTCVSNIENGSLNQLVFLAHLVRYLAALTIADSVQGQAVLLVEPDRMFEDCVKDVLANRGVQVRICSTDETRRRLSPGTVYLHPAAPRREVKALFPPDGAWVIDMLPRSSKLSEILVQSLPDNCWYISRSEFLTAESRGSYENPMVVESVWEQAVSLTLAKIGDWQADLESTVISVPDLLQSKAPVLPFQIVDWRAERCVSQLVKPLAGTQMLDPTKTYVLIGMSRDFGQSLCALFVEQGARTIVLASRNPPARSPMWQTELLSRGITIRFEALDVTDLEKVETFKRKLEESLPPVGGVVNGAMVLEDRVFSQMTPETLHKVMDPKTVGSRNLDQVFDDPEMDFFIMTSSFAAVGGHAGQSNYAAANMYMNGLAASRRQRGLPGSVLNIGVIYGLGSLHREKNDVYKWLEREGYPPISERDIHQMFLEAIAAGKPVPGQVYDITTGLRRFDVNTPTLHWHKDPRFSHFTLREEDSAADATESNPQQQTLKDLVDQEETREGVVTALVDAFAAHLQSQLQLSEGSVTGDCSITGLGVDSLVAVEIRSWIWRTLGKDVAVMKILDSSSISGLCGEIADAVMESRA
ncbi:hypothetical protein VTK56DRAFT_6469 [Thermocarpiscus australiensis]